MILNALNVTPFITSGLELAHKAQVSYDLTVAHITKVTGGFIGKFAKGINEYEEISFVINGNGNKVWELEKGETYSITFQQNIKLDSTHIALIWHKSTVLRCAAQLVSGVYDPGFESTKGCGCELICNAKFLSIEEGAPLAQLLIFECQESEMYNGNYQGNKDLL